MPRLSSVYHWKFATKYGDLPSQILLSHRKALHFDNNSERSLPKMSDSGRLACINYSMRSLVNAGAKKINDKGVSHSIILNEIYWLGEFKLPMICVSLWDEIETSLYSFLTFSFRNTNKYPFTETVTAFLSRRTAKQRLLTRRVRVACDGIWDDIVHYAPMTTWQLEPSFTLLLSASNSNSANDFISIKDIHIGHNIFIPACLPGFHFIIRESAGIQALEAVLSRSHDTVTEYRVKLKNQLFLNGIKFGDPFSHASFPLSLEKLNSALHRARGPLSQLPKPEPDGRVDAQHFQVAWQIIIQEKISSIIGHYTNIYEQLTDISQNSR